MKLAHNAQSIEEVREDLMLYISLDQDVTSFADMNIEDILEQVNMILISQETPFEDVEAISTYLVMPEQKPEAYKPKGRISHVTNYYN